MMKKLLLFLLLAVTGLSLRGAEFLGIGRSPEGLIQVEDLKFGIVFWGKDWVTVLQKKDPSVLTFPGEGGIETEQGIRRDGTFRVSENTKFQFTETVRRVSVNEAEFHFAMKSGEGIPANYITWQTHVPVGDYEKEPAIFNGEKLPAYEGKDIFRVGVPDGVLILKRNNGTLEIRGRFSIIIRKNPWGVDVRLLFAGSNGAVRNATLSFRMIYRPKTSYTLNLRPQMNMGFRDDVAEDRTGGWTDQGPDNDLRAMAPEKREFAGITFDVIDPAKNSGKSCLAMKGKERPYFAQEAAIVVAPGVSGEALYLLNGLAWAPDRNVVSGMVRVTYSDGSSKEFALKCGIDTGNFWNPMPQKNAAIGWRAQNGEAGIGLYVTRLPLDSSKSVSKVEFRSADHVWMILAATISDLDPDNRVQFAKLVMKPNDSWCEFPFVFQTQPGSVADLSSLVEAPAGKYGFLTVRGENFEFEQRPGVSVRFWGTNVCAQALFMTNANTVQMLDELKAMGYNSIRLHHFDHILTAKTDVPGSFNPENMRKLDFLLAEAKKRGIYLTIDLYTCRYPKEIAKFGTLSPTEYKMLCYFDQDAYQNLFGFAKRLLGHVNEYTGIEWKNDPSVVTINLINESTLPIAAGRMTPRVQKIVEAAFERFAGEKGADISGVNRARLYEQFLADAGKEFFRRMKNDLTTFGVKIPLCDQNFAEPALDTRNTFDYVDTHFYWGHPTYLGKLWSLPSQTRSDSAVARLAGGIRDVLMTRIQGKPMTITEWNYCYPNPHSFEGPFLTAAYSAFHNFNGLWQFAYSHSAEIDKTAPLGPFDYHSNPVMNLADRAGALLFLRGDVKTSVVSVSVTKKAENLFRSRLPLVVRTERFSPSSTSVAKVLAATDGENPGMSGIPIFYENNEQKLLASMSNAGIIPRDSVNFEKDIITSSTGELLLKPKEQFFLIRTPRSEALVLNGNASGKGDFLTVTKGKADAIFFAGSLDG